MKIKEYLKLLYIPLSLIVTYFIIIFIWKLMGLPEGDNLVKIITDFFNTYGLILVFIGSLIEGFFLLGQYFPGGMIIFLGVISAGNNGFRAFQVVSIVMIAFFIAYFLNYLLGYYGWYKLFVKFGLKKALDNAQEKLKTNELRAILLSYWEPNLASIMATAAGTLKMPIKKFLIYSLIGILIWETFWGLLVFFLGSKALTLMGIKYVVAIFLIWVILIVISQLIKNRFKNNQKNGTKQKSKK
jgi:membrane-associated protein